MKFGWQTRAGLVVSAVWLCLVFLIADDYHRVGQVLGLGFLPLMVIWGIIWAVSGWRAQRQARPEIPEAEVLETKRKRNLRIRTVIAVVAVLGLGLFAATWQFHAANNEFGGNAVSVWFGEWLVYGLFAYVVFRFIPKPPPGFAAVLAAIVVVGGVNYKAYSAIALDRQAYDSLAKAAPLINKIQSGSAVSDQEVRDAKTGMMEPLMLAQAAYTRDVLAIVATYQKAIDGLQPELMLTPPSLASPNIRAQTREKLKLWQQATAEYKTQLDAATARGKLGVQAAQSQMPAEVAGSAVKGFDDSTAQITNYVNGLVASARESSGTITAILDLMDANPGSYAVDKGPPVNLLFRDEVLLGKYRMLMGAVMAASQREAEVQARLVKAQSDRIVNLTNLLKR